MEREIIAKRGGYPVKRCYGCKTIVYFNYVDRNILEFFGYKRFKIIHSWMNEAGGQGLPTSYMCRKCAKDIMNKEAYELCKKEYMEEI